MGAFLAVCLWVWSFLLVVYAFFLFILVCFVLELIYKLVQR